MGFGLQRFVHTVDENLLCGICSLVLEDAVLTPCGHSFCRACIETWLARPGCLTCPECRGRIYADEARPIRAVRSLIGGMDTRCHYTGRGCKVVTRLDDTKSHSESCPFAPIQCAGCEKEMSRRELPDHHMTCDAIAAVVGEDEGTGGLERMRSLLRKSHSHPQVLVSCISSLEVEVSRLKRDLEVTKLRNKNIERELRKVKEELDQKRKQLTDQQYINFDPEYEYGYTPQSVASLACLIARFLLKKPPYIDRTRVFDAIRRCYEGYARCGNKHEHDVHMLVAVAHSSNWFTDNQKLNFHCWLQCIARHRQWAFNLEFSPSQPSQYSQGDIVAVTDE